ncbi:hypothetical protein C8T65DRAFT_730177 [Cerioporus squamosus]|nr:hypothetical protein C8T65DRAFT_730177 [Cerioporus squamosus]
MWRNIQLSLWFQVDEGLKAREDFLTVDHCHPPCSVVPASILRDEELEAGTASLVNGLKWLMKGMIFNTVGPAAMCSFDPPLVMTLVGRYHAPSPSEGRHPNPTTAFELYTIQIETFPNLSPKYLESISVSPMMHGLKDKEYRKRYRPGYADCKRRTNTCFITLTHPYKPGLPLSQVQKDAVLKDVIDFCTSSINDRFPLPYNEGLESVLVFPGKFMRERKEWVWKPLFLDWDEYISRGGGHKALDRALKRLSPGTTPATLLQFIASLPIV